MSRCIPCAWAGYGIGMQQATAWSASPHRAESAGGWEKLTRSHHREAPYLGQPAKLTARIEDELS